MYKISIIICCFNSEERIGSTLDHLERCRIPKGCQAELILVDNNSSDATATVARARWRREEMPLNIVTETHAGLIYAREAGISAASGDIFLFVDDDNWLDKNYLEETLHILSSRRDVGIVGGVGCLPVDSSRPSWFESYQGRFAVGPKNASSGKVDFVYGAGMVIRRVVMDELKSRGFHSFLTGRSGNALSSGEDSELCYAARLLGWTIWRESSANFQHAIPESRMTEDYLIRLTRGIGLSIPVLAVYAHMLKFRSPTLVFAASLVSMMRNYSRKIQFWFKQLIGFSLSNRVNLEYHRSVNRAWFQLFNRRFAKLVCMTNTLHNSENKNNLDK